MLTRKIDTALDAMASCRIRTPMLAECYRLGTPERIALDDLIAALERTDAILLRRDAAPPSITTA